LDTVDQASVNDLTWTNITINHWTDKSNLQL